MLEKGMGVSSSKLRVGTMSIWLTDGEDDAFGSRARALEKMPGRFE